jgi:hypothetical protein
MNEKHVGAYDGNPEFFRYRKEPGMYLLLVGVLNFITAGAFMYAIINLFVSGDLGLRNAGLITGTLGLIALWGLRYWNTQMKADKEEMFTVWAIEHHGLTPVDYKIGSTGAQRFTSMETGAEVSRIVTNDDIEFKGSEHPKCIRVSLV